jgi:hypothetical protein
MTKYPRAAVWAFVGGVIALVVLVAIALATAL